VVTPHITSLTPFQLIGIVNLLTAFPQLASGILVARYSLSPTDEFRVRGYPSQLLNLLSMAARIIDADMLNLIVSKLESSRRFLKAYADSISQRLRSKSINDRTLVLNFIEYCSREGSKLAEPIVCLHEALAEKLVKLTESDLNVIREVDVAFRYLYRYEDPDEPTNEYVETYYCAPRWSLRASKDLALSLSGDQVGLKELMLKLLEEEPKCYALLRAAVFEGLKGVEEAGKLLGLSINSCSVPARLVKDELLNVGLLMLARDEVREVEEEYYQPPGEEYVFDRKLGVYRHRKDASKLIAYGVGGAVTTLLAVKGSEERNVSLKLVVKEHERKPVLELASKMSSFEVQVHVVS
jgi:hypothetical protein